MRPSIVITGASRGIGAATARRAAAMGYNVAVGYLNDADAAASVVAKCEEAGAAARAIRVDVAAEVDVVALFDEVTATWGALSGLVNNAGVVDLQMRVDAMNAARIRRMLDVNVLGTFLCAREAVRRMSTSYGGAGGAIVNVSSRAAVLGSPGEYVDYAASKAAVDGLTIGLAKEVAAEGIRVNAVRPGLIETEIHARSGEPGRVERLVPTVPMGRAGHPEEVADAIMWLLSSASFVTGALLDVGGGR